MVAMIASVNCANLSMVAMTAAELELPSSLSSEERKFIHLVSQHMGFKSRSKGWVVVLHVHTHFFPPLQHLLSERLRLSA